MIEYYSMDKQEIIELTNKIYQITLLFPKKEPLRYKMREVADEVLAGAEIQQFEVLDSYFEVAKWQNWVSYFDILELQEKYAKIKDAFRQEGGEIVEEKSLKIEFPAKIPLGPVSTEKLDERKEKILDILREMGRVQVYQVKEILPQVSKRTLRRDFDKLLRQGLVERIGQRNETFYQLKGQTRV